MEAYRDQYATIFNNGHNVVSLNVSMDADTTLASWARESDFPMLFASDVGGAAGKAYGVHDSARNTNRRVTFVIGPDGKIVYRAMPFSAMSADAYTELDAAINKASAKP
ncbi:MAG: peroxiredoxin family protein [Gemmatimonadaceae bacterium]